VTPHSHEDHVVTTAPELLVTLRFHPRLGWYASQGPGLVGEPLARHRLSLPWVNGHQQLRCTADGRLELLVGQGGVLGVEPLVRLPADGDRLLEAQVFRQGQSLLVHVDALTEESP